VVFSGIAIGFIGFGVWAHHMFAVGLGPVANTAFGLSTAIIAVPTGVKIFNWMGTMYKGDLWFATPMLFSVGAVAMFVIGGLSGVTHAIVPSDYQQTDTYYIVAHFHYVLFGGAIFGLFSGMYFWWPKIFGRMLNEKAGKWQFWLQILGFNMAFGPMHILGLQGMIRREYTYPATLGLTFWNQVSTVGAYLIALAVLLFIINVIRTQRKPKGLTNEDPWDARTIEWMTSCPPPVHNFDEIPTIHSLDEFWHRKYVEDHKTGTLVPVQAGAAPEHDEGHEPAGHSIHLPSPSFWPLVAAIGLPIIGYGILYSWWLVGLGAFVMLVGFYGWALEPSVAEE
jgi:cytochrome c oxidase subunit 1